MHRENVKYEIKNMIWVLNKNTITNRLLIKLNHKMIDFYFIIKVINSFYQVQFFELTKIFEIFHSSSSKKRLKIRFENKSTMKKKWEFDNILDVKKHYRRV